MGLKPYHILNRNRPQKFDLFTRLFLTRIEVQWAGHETKSTSISHPSISLLMMLSTKKAGRRERMKIDTAASGLPSTNHTSNTAGMEIQ